MDKKMLKNSAFRTALNKILEKEEWHRRQGVLAKEVGVSQGYVSDLRSGKRTPSISTATKIAKVLNMDLASFLELAHDNNENESNKNHVISINHEKLVSRFQDKDLAYRLNEALIDIENLNPQLFEDVANYVLRTAEDQKRLSQYRPTRICEHLRVCEKKVINLQQIYTACSTAIVRYDGVVMGAHDNECYPTLFQNRVIVGHNLILFDGLIRNVQDHIKQIKNVIITGKPYIGKLYYDLRGNVKTRICHYRKINDLHSLCVLYPLPRQHQNRRCIECNAQNAKPKTLTTASSVKTAASFSPK